MSRHLQYSLQKIVFSLVLVGSTFFVGCLSPAFALTQCEVSPPVGGYIYPWRDISNPNNNSFSIAVNNPYTSYSLNASSDVYQCTSGPQIGITVGGNGGVGGSNLKEVAISDCPGDFSVPSGCSAMISSGSVMFTNQACLNLKLDSNTTGSPALRHRVYINVRPVSPATTASATLSSTDFGCTPPGASNTRIDGSKLNSAEEVGAVASNNPNEKVALSFSPYLTSSPYGLVCPLGTAYQIKLERAFPSMAGIFSPMNATLSLTEFDIAGNEASPNCKAVVPMTPGVRRITLPPARDITWEICQIVPVCDPDNNCVNTKVCNPPPALNNNVDPWMCNISTNYYFDENNNYVRPTFFLNVASQGPHESAINVTGICLPVGATAPLPPLPPDPDVPPLPASCTEDPARVRPIYGVGDDKTVTSLGIVETHQSFSFTAPSSQHNCGVRFHFFDNNQVLPQSGLREIVFSTCPNVFPSANSNANQACRIIVNDNTTFDLNTPYNGMCSFPPGTQLYMNVRPFPDTTGGRTTLRFTSKWLDGTCTPRTPFVPPVFPQVPPTALPPKPVTIEGCAPDILNSMRDNGQQALSNLDNITNTLIKLPQPATGSDCIRDILNVWDIDLLASLGGAIAGYIDSYLPFSSFMPGITLTQSSSYGIIMNLVNDMLKNNMNKLICTDIWKGVAQARAAVTLKGDGSFSFAPPAIPAIGKLGEITIP